MKKAVPGNEGDGWLCVFCVRVGVGGGRGEGVMEMDRRERGREGGD